MFKKNIFLNHSNSSNRNDFFDNLGLFVNIRSCQNPYESRVVRVVVRVV